MRDGGISAESLRKDQIIHLRPRSMLKDEVVNVLRSAGFLVMGGPIFGSKMMDYHRETVDFEAILR